jgi:hypothetical protein
MVTGYGPDGQGLIPGRERVHSIQISSGVHPDSWPMGTGDVSPGVKQLGHEADHSLPSNAEVKNIWILITTPPYIFMALCLIMKYRDNFYLLQLPVKCLCMHLRPKI